MKQWYALCVSIFVLENWQYSENKVKKSIEGISYAATAPVNRVTIDTIIVSFCND